MTADELGLRITQWVCACASEYLGGLVFVLVFDVFVLLCALVVLHVLDVLLLGTTLVGKGKARPWCQQ